MFLYKNTSKRVSCDTRLGLFKLINDRIIFLHFHRFVFTLYTVLDFYSLLILMFINNFYFGDIDRFSNSYLADKPI